MGTEIEVCFDLSQIKLMCVVHLTYSVKEWLSILREESGTVPSVRNMDY